MRVREYCGIPYFVDDGPPRRVWGIDDIDEREEQTAMNDKTWEHLFEAMQGLGEASIKMRAPGAWYVHQPGVEVKRGETSFGEATADGKTPEEAVTIRWGHLTSTNKKQYVEHKRGRILRRVRWTGWFWQDIAVEGEADA